MKVKRSAQAINKANITEKNSHKNRKGARHFMLIILVIRRLRSERSRFKANLRKIVCVIPV
jgi:hypothetical protein